MNTNGLGSFEGFPSFSPIPQVRPVAQNPVEESASAGSTLKMTMGTALVATPFVATNAILKARKLKAQGGSFIDAYKMYKAGYQASVGAGMLRKVKGNFLDRLIARAEQVELSKEAFVNTVKNIKEKGIKPLINNIKRNVSIINKGKEVNAIKVAAEAPKKAGFIGRMLKSVKNTAVGKFVANSAVGKFCSNLANKPLLKSANKLFKRGGGALFAALAIVTEAPKVISAFKNNGAVSGMKQLAKSTFKTAASIATFATVAAVTAPLAVVGPILGPVLAFSSCMLASGLADTAIEKILPDEKVAVA